MRAMTRTAHLWLDLMRGVLVFAAVAVAGAHAEVIVTGGKTGTYFQIGNNLKEIVSPALEVRDSKGSWANVEDLSQTKGVSLAIVQSDVYAAFVYLRDSQRSARGNQTAVWKAPRKPQGLHAAVQGGNPFPGAGRTARLNSYIRSGGRGSGWMPRKAGLISPH